MFFNKIKHYSFKSLWFKKRVYDSISMKPSICLEFQVVQEKRAGAGTSSSVDNTVLCVVADVQLLHIFVKM